MKVTAATLFLLTLNGQYKNVSPTSPTSTLRMDLFNGEEQCIGQDFDEGDEIIFKIGASSKSDHGHSQTLRVTVSDPSEEIIAEEKIKIVDTQKIKNIPQTIEADGVHEMCFRYEGHNDKIPVQIYFGVDYSSKRARIGVDPSKGVGKEEIPSLESELILAEESLNEISVEIEFARKQEILLTEATESMATRVQWFSVFSMVILFVTSLWQIIYLRHFFTSKKLL
mmetsp:Transcript_3118/g.3264  ORF Transcript_3118/g.3264 Transcript_3118/m.3264 type:complete len:225 (+) Transcript_3118:105-779(+)